MVEVRLRAVEVAGDRRLTEMNQSVKERKHNCNLYGFCCMLLVT